MNKTLIVIAREYRTRIRKPSFWLLAVIIPLLLTALYALPLRIASRPIERAVVMVVDETSLFQHAFRSNDVVAYRSAGSLSYAEQQLRDSDDVQAIIYIPARETTIPHDAFLYYHSQSPSMTLQSNVDRQLQTILRNNILRDVHNISADDYALICNTGINMHVQDLETGRDTFVKFREVVGWILAVLIFLVIFLCGSQVMRGVLEEKTSRIVEVIISSIRPFQLMMGKVIGTALVGLTQFAIWLIIGGAGFVIVQQNHADLLHEAQIQQQGISMIATKGSEAVAQMEATQSAVEVPDLIAGLASINFSALIIPFLLYFILGYLLYGSLFAAVGSTTDSDTDSQQYSLMISLPLLLTFLFIPVITNQPSGNLAVWLSLIPFTAPIAMMFRIPFGVPYWQIVVSLMLLVVCFVLCVWMASRIYRNSILWYGKKIKWSNLGQLLVSRKREK